MNWELAAGLGSGGNGLSESSTLGHVWGYAVGLEMTRRDVQAEAKKMERPWDMGKGSSLGAIGEMMKADGIP